jgi:hypothetical protein
VWFHKRKRAAPPTNHPLRGLAFSVSASELGIASAIDSEQVWGLLMDIGYPTGTATLATFADGTTSLYYSTGGGIIGAGEHDTVRAAARQLLTIASAHLSLFSAASEMPSPEVGRVRFYLRTFDGLKSLEAAEQDLAHGRHRAAPVFHAANVVITAIRELPPQ